MPNLDWIPEELESVITYQDNKYLIGCVVSECTVQRQSAGKSSILKKYSEGKTSSLTLCYLHGGKAVQFPKSEIDSWPEGHKRCKVCLEVKPFRDFHKHSGALFGYNTLCIECRTPASQSAYSKISWERRLFDRAKSRSTRKGLEFAIQLSDIVIPEICPVLEEAIVFESNHQYAPSLDRIDSSIGYVPENIQVTSRRANVLKNNMTADEARKLLEWFTG